MQQFPVGALITLVVFVAGCIFQAGYLTARVTHLERWREEQRDANDQIFEGLRRLEGLIRNGDKA